MPSKSRSGRGKYSPPKKKRKDRHGHPAVIAQQPAAAPVNEPVSSEKEPDIESMVLDILSKLENREGLMIKGMQDIMKKMGKDYSYNAIFNNINKLIRKSKVESTDPNKQRYVKYRIVKQEQKQEESEHNPFD